MAGAGGLRGRFQFQHRAQDGAGDHLGEYEPSFPTVAGDLTWLRGSEPVMAQRLQGIRPAVIRVRASSWTRGLTSDHRCVNARTDEVLSIITVTPDDSGAWIDVLCETGGAPA